MCHISLVQPLSSGSRGGFWWHQADRRQRGHCLQDCSFICPCFQSKFAACLDKVIWSLRFCVPQALQNEDSLGCIWKSYYWILFKFELIKVQFSQTRKLGCDGGFGRKSPVTQQQGLTWHCRCFPRQDVFYYRLWLQPSLLDWCPCTESVFALRALH